MRVFRPLLSVLTLMFALLALPVHAAPLAQAPTVQQLPASASLLTTDGTWIAWISTVTPAGQSAPRTTIVAQETGTGRRVTVAADLPFGVTHLSITSGTLVYSSQDSGATTISAYRLADGFQRTLARGVGLSAPAAAGDTIYWWQRPEPPANAQLYQASLSTDASALLTEAPATLYGISATRASAGWVAWARGVGTAKVVVCHTLEVVPVSGGAVRTIDDLGCGTPHFALQWDNLIYLNRDGELVNLHLLTGARRASGPHCAPITAPGGSVTTCGGITSFTSDGRYAFWAKLRGAEASGGSDVWGFDTVTGSAFVVAAQPTQDANSGWPETGAANGVLAWLTRPAAGQAELHLRAISATLPSAPEAARSEALFFPETQHTLGGEFRGFWERNGGLSVFGFPLTREFIQESRDDGAGYAVQYFERQRFEFHPENAGTPYSVLIGRMGAEALAAQGIDWTTLPKADPAAPHYFAATGQAIAPEFWGYWRSNGLELGDAGVSEREALALWGYPISPPRVERLENGEERLVQWFERARFEYHPNNPDPYKVLLGRLASEQVAGFGWQ